MKDWNETRKQVVFLLDSARVIFAKDYDVDEATRQEIEQCLNALDDIACVCTLKEGAR